jgi:D-alanine-D-alanine ligase
MVKEMEETKGNTRRKLKIAVLFGGRSGEHEVSLDSARSVLAVLDPQKYEIHPVGITHDGAWLTSPEAVQAGASPGDSI